MTKTEIDTVIVMKNALDELRKAAETMSRCMAANHISPLPSFYDAHNRACYALGCAEALAQQQPVAYLAWRDGKPCYEGEDVVCADPVWPVDADDYRTSMPVYAGAAPTAQSDDKDLLTIAAMDAYQMGKRDALAQQDDLVNASKAEQLLASHDHSLRAEFGRMKAALAQQVGNDKFGSKAFASYLEACDSCRIEPDVAGAFNSGYQSGMAQQGEPVAWLHAKTNQVFTSEPPPRLKASCTPLYAGAAPAAQQGEQPVAWPQTPEQISDFIGSNFVWREGNDVAPKDGDKYCVTAHDLLSAFREWPEFAAAPVQPECDAARVLEWMRTPNRKAAQFAFTEGPERQAAYWIEIAQSEPAAQQVAPVAWMYTLEYGAAVADTKVSVRQLNYPFGVCGADYLAKNDDGVSYVRQTPLYKAQSVPDSLLAKLPGGKKTDQWDSARMADYDQGWNDYRKAVKAVLAGAAPVSHPDARKVIEQMVVALEIAERHLAYVEITEAREAGQKWMKENK